jgi:hypothetical protein
MFMLRGYRLFGDKIAKFRTTVKVYKNPWKLHLDIGQESAYTCKLSELPPGTSQWFSSLCATQRKYKVIGY